MRKAFVVIALLAGVASAGDFQTGTSEGHDFAASQKGYVKGLAEGTDSKAALYGGGTTVSADLHPCNQANAQGQQTCGGEAIIPGDNPDQYYGMSKAQLEDNARVKASSDPTAQYMFDSHNTRPEFDVRRDDPLFKHQDANQSKMVNLSETYTGCKQIAYGGVVMTSEDKQCKKIGTAVYKETTCNRALNVTCSNANAGQPRPYTLADFNVTGAWMPKSVSGNTFSFGTTYNNRGQNCTGYTTNITFEIDDVSNILEFITLMYVWDDRIDVWVNGTKVFRAVGSNVSLTAPEQYILGRIVRCEFGSVFSRSTNTDLKPYLKNGTNTITILNKVGGDGNAFMQFRAVRKWGCTEADSTTLTCPESFDMAGANLINTSCSSGPATRVISGANVTRSCWAWDETYKWESLPAYAEDSMCQSYRDQGCVPKNTVCDVTNPSGWCQESTLTFTCSSESPEKTMEVCGDTLVCPDGHCYDAYKEPQQDSTQDFMKAASYLAAMEDMKNEFNPNDVTVWKGEFKECSVNETLIGSDACCTGGTGTINRLGKSCNATEEYIAQARDDERASFVRRWKECTQEVLGVCVNELTHYEFCVWPSKLARIVQDQGRPMLGQVVDNPCPGFKLQNPNEFAGIDWSRIDLSDYYEDVQAKYNATAKPSPTGLTTQMQQSNSAMQDELTQKMQQYYGQ